MAPDALSAIANCRSCSNSRCSWPMTKAYGSSARSVPGQLQARGFPVNRGNAQAFEDREDRCGHALEGRSSQQFRLAHAERTPISRPRASREYRRAGCTPALWKASRRHMVLVDPQGRTIFSNRRMAEILRGRISNRCRTIRFCPRFRQPLRRSVNCGGIPASGNRRSSHRTF